jgi:iron complex transport system substrate-binding protein
MKKTWVDHLNRTIECVFPPQRIISLCPSITETLFALGLADQIVGKTRYCIHPEEGVKRVKNVGGTKTVREDVIHALNPDLILAEKEENTKEMVESLARKNPVFVANVENWRDALNLIRDLGRLTDREERAFHLAGEIESMMQNLPRTNGRKVAYLIWKNPYMVAGNHTYIHSLLEHCGFVNVFRDHESRYPVVSEEDLQRTAPEFLFMSTEPFPFAESHRAEMQARFPQIKVMRVDGEIFSWHGARMRKLPDYLKQLIREMER